VGIFVALHSRFKEYAAALDANKNRSEEENYMLSSVNFLNSTIASDFRDQLTEIHQLTSRGEITSDTLYAILVPKSFMVIRCALTGLPILFELISWVPIVIAEENSCHWHLNLQNIDLGDRPITGSVAFGCVSMTIQMRLPTRGVVKITSLRAYPLEFHPDPAGLKENILARGKKWFSLIGVHHK